MSEIRQLQEEMTKHACHVIHKEELEPKRKNDGQNSADWSSEREKQIGAKLFPESGHLRQKVTSKS